MTTGHIDPLGFNASPLDRDAQYKQDRASFHNSPGAVESQARRWQDIVDRANTRALQRAALDRQKTLQAIKGSSEIPTGPTSYDVVGGNTGSGGAVVKGVTLSKPFPPTAAAKTGDDLEGDYKLKQLRVRGFVGEDRPIDLVVQDDDGETALVPPQVSVDIYVTKGVDYLGKANSHRSGAASSTDIRNSEYDLTGTSNISTAVFGQMYRMDFGD